MAPPAEPVTNDELIKHRLKELEEFAVGAREMERRVDTLSLQLGALEKAAVEFQNEMRLSGEATRKSLGKLHDRLDAMLTQQAREEGREQGRYEIRAEAAEEGRLIGVAQGKEEVRVRTWKVVAYSITATTGLLLLLVAALNFALH